MPILRPQSALGAAAIAAMSFWVVAAGAQQDTAPPAGKPSETTPGPQTTPSPQKQPSVAPAGQDLVGLSVFSSDGTRVGDVRSVNTGPTGKVAALHVKTGGFLGFGGRTVAIPEGTFARKGPDIRLNLSAEQVDNLPAVKEEK